MKDLINNVKKNCSIIMYTEAEGESLIPDIWNISLKDLKQQLEDPTRHIHLEACPKGRSLCRTKVTTYDREDKFPFAVFIDTDQMWDSVLRQWDKGRMEYDETKICKRYR